VTSASGDEGVGLAPRDTTKDAAVGSSAQRSWTRVSPASAVSASGAGGTARMEAGWENAVVSSKVTARTA
jgi:hypothetical protein